MLAHFIQTAPALQTNACACGQQVASMPAAAYIGCRPSDMSLFCRFLGLNVDTEGNSTQPWTSQCCACTCCQQAWGRAAVTSALNSRCEQNT
jgi:hypothetical protein